VSIGVGVLCKRARKNDYHDDDDQYLSGHDHYAGQESQRLLFNEWHNERTATLGTTGESHLAFVPRTTAALFAGNDWPGAVRLTVGFKLRPDSDPS
jgi:hypothetical protein